VSQNAHWLGAFAFVVGLPVLCGKWITWWAVIAVVFVYAPIKECAIDPHTEPAGWSSAEANGTCDGEDFGFYVAGAVLGLVVIYFSQLHGSMWPWPARCRPCCPPSRAEEAEYSLCCGNVRLTFELEDDDPRLTHRLQRERERVELLQRRDKELQTTGLRHD
jgi:hypothetical protein